MIMKGSFEEFANRISSMDDLDLSDFASLCDEMKVNCHLAVMRQPYLDYVLSGEKKVESRFSKVPCAPYKKVKKGDIIVFKETGGPLRAVSMVIDVSFFGNIDSRKNMTLLLGHKDELMISDDFIEKKKDSKYVSIMYLDKVIPIHCVNLIKNDMRSWVVFDYDSNGRLF